jgi:hypothetical protein
MSIWDFINPYTWMFISFPQFGNFSAIISLNFFFMPLAYTCPSSMEWKDWFSNWISWFYSYFLIFYQFECSNLSCLQALIFCIPLDLVYWWVFQLSFLFELLDFTFSKFQTEFFQNFYSIYEFLFHILCCLPYFT